MAEPYVELRSVSKYFGSVVALKDVSFDVCPGEVHCLLGDNGAGKSTLIKTLSGVYTPDEGEIRVQGKPTRFASPADTRNSGIATVYQDLALVPLMSVARNFFLGREPMRKFGPIRQFDTEFANRTAYDELAAMGIQLRDPEQPVGTLSGGERQCLAIARAVYFGAKVLILDEPTSALGVHQASVVLKLIVQSKARGIGVIFISHNVHHAYVVGDRFTLLKRGKSTGTYAKSEIDRDQLLNLMAGGKELVDLEQELTKAARSSPA
ncbi:MULTISPECIES: ATP-binding cassette domain-containing protein [unclassified Mesorhizobium]|jgi:simple sugar transport system ATP-binding protein|uniref:ATP-binding cassette domain-containing protein n=1 Tax=unclassified Mesorhizobium TaxID=325217 RepID=UPI000FCA9EC4|nr:MULTISPECIES: ATP-binding cassette domain-containing protein [unclassified Mesorhizobium]RUX95683.1 sugar ABC transporter ATP-binding protein [Mesorhizobium sp. M7D.F.Ca.US.004.01.2.1]RVA36812.1 sugar ABC transporter ATP-binding protein [Mesorhizobium sp. M7D.F.Ca.US.004.03.1.1]